MLKLEDIREGTRVEGLVPTGAAEIVKIDRYGPDTICVFYRTPTGATTNCILTSDSDKQQILDNPRSYLYDC